MPRLLLALLLPLPLVAADPPAHRADGDRALAARRVLVKYCAECHSGEKGKGGGRLSVTDHRVLVGIGGPRAFADTQKGRSQIVEFLEDGSMPPGGRPRPTDAEVKAVREWAEAGSKEFPAKLDDAAVFGMIAADLADQPEKGWVRYVSLAHLADADPATVAEAEGKLADALSPLLPKGETVWGVLAPLPASAGTVYRLNVNKLHWDADNVFQVWGNGAPKRDVFPIVPFDLIQLENPHPPAVDAKATEEVLRKMNPHRDKKPLAQLRAVPFVRGDWLAGALRKDGEPTPLADELRALADLDRALLKDNTAPPPPGPTPRSPFKGGEVGPGESVWAWYRPGTTQKNPPIKLTALLHEPVGESVPGGGGDVVIHATANKAVTLTLVEVLPGRKVSVLDLEKGTGAKLKASVDPVAVAPNKTGVHTVVIPKEANYPAVYFLVFATTDPPKAPPVVVGSKHTLGTVVFRVLPSEDDADGTTAAVRAVIEVKVKKEE